LSHFAYWPLAKDEDAVSGNANIFAKVGNSPYLLRRIDTVRLDEMRPIQTHDLPNGETILCNSEGIIEPIALAMLHQLRRDPAETKQLMDWAIDQDAVYLVWRLMGVATAAMTITNSAVATAAVEISEKGRVYWRKRVGVDIVHDELPNVALSGPVSHIAIRPTQNSPIIRGLPPISKTEKNRRKQKRKNSKKARKMNAKQKNPKFH
jgi:hypothetical protein